jgi:hypothetical protein
MEIEYSEEDLAYALIKFDGQKLSENITCTSCGKTDTGLDGKCFMCWFETNYKVCALCKSRGRSMFMCDACRAETCLECCKDIFTASDTFACELCNVLIAPKKLVQSVLTLDEYKTFERQDNKIWNMSYCDTCRNHVATRTCEHDTTLCKRLRYKVLEHGGLGAISLLLQHMDIVYFEKTHNNWYKKLIIARSIRYLLADAQEWNRIDKFVNEYIKTDKNDFTALGRLFNIARQGIILFTFLKK